MNIISIFDILASSLTVISLYLIPKSYKYWLLYMIGCICFIVTCASNRIPGLTIMGILLFIISIKNYLIGKRRKI